MSDEMDAMRAHLAREEKALKILGLKTLWNEDQVKRIWRKKAFEVHPDRNHGSRQSHQDFIFLACACRFLLEGKGGEELDSIHPEDRVKDASDERHVTEKDYHDWWKSNYF